MTIKTRSFFIILTTGIFSPRAAYSCGVCVDYILDWRLPFLRPLILIFSVWILIKIVFWIIGKATTTSIPLTHSKRPWLTIIALVVILIAVWIFGMGSPLLPFLVVIIPSWFFAIYRSQRRMYSVQYRKKLQSLFIYFQWVTLSAIGFIVIHSIVSFNSTERLIRKLAYPKLTSPAQQRLISKGKEIYPEVIPIVVNFNEDNVRYRNKYINLMKVIREIDEPSIAFIIAEKFKNITYNDDIYIDEVFIESAKTLTALDEEIASEAILLKLKNLKKNEKIPSYQYRKIVDGLIESIAEIDNQTLVSAYRILGSPDLGSDIEAYKEWWKNSGKTNERK